MHPLDSHPMSFPWPSSFDRVPDAVWAQQPVEALALNYDTVEMSLPRRGVSTAGNQLV